MDQNAASAAKAEIESLLQDYLREEGIEILKPPGIDTHGESPLVMVEGIENLPLEGSLLQWEIRVVLGVFGKRWQCKQLIDGIYRALAGYRPTGGELRALLTSLHIEVTQSTPAQQVSKRATIRYILSEAG
jgi:hypothetical protein